MNKYIFIYNDKNQVQSRYVDEWNCVRDRNDASRNELVQVSSFKFYLSHTRLYRDCITSSEMRVGSAPWTVQILKKQHKGSKHKIRWMKNKI